MNDVGSINCPTYCPDDVKNYSSKLTVSAGCQ